MIKFKITLVCFLCFLKAIYNKIAIFFNILYTFLYILCKKSKKFIKKSLFILFFILILQISLLSEVHICNSMWVISDNSRKFSCINSDGILNEPKFREYIRKFANAGADHFSTLPFLCISDDKNDYKFVNNMEYMPYMLVNNKYDLHQLNTKYFDNVRRMAKICNEYNTIFIFTLFDRCHGTFKASPYYNNVQNIDCWLQKNEINRTFIFTILEALSGTNFKLEICNEPFSDKFHSFFFWTWDILQKNGITKSQVIHGADFVANNYYWKLELVDDLGSDWRVNSYTTVHQFDYNVANYLTKFQNVPPETKGRKFFISDDGLKQKPNTNEWQNLAYYFLSKNPNAFDMGYILARCNAPYEQESLNFDWFACKGISEAIKLISGSYPVNYGKYPDIKININNKDFVILPERNDRR